MHSGWRMMCVSVTLSCELILDILIRHSEKCKYVKIAITLQLKVDMVVL